MTETHEPWEERLEQYLHEKGLRMTRQRLAIAREFFAITGHPNIDGLCARVRRADPSIGQATVYRTLKLFVDSGLANQSRFGDGPARYESADVDHHDHLICVDCGRIVEFRNDTIERLQEKIAAAHGFEMTDHEMVIYGHCSTPACVARRSQKAKAAAD